MGKNIMKLNEEDLKQIVAESVRRVLKEIYEEIDYPDDIYEWGKKAQELGLELHRLCGKYRFENEELYGILKTIDCQYNSVCGDLSTYSIAGHWDR